MSTGFDYDPKRLKRGQAADLERLTRIVALVMPGATVEPWQFGSLKITAADAPGGLGWQGNYYALATAMLGLQIDARFSALAALGQAYLDGDSAKIDAAADAARDADRRLVEARAAHAGAP